MDFFLNFLCFTCASQGDSRSFDNLRRRKAPSMGWCRLCKVDCETVEGLDLHSQTREHQKMAMDIVKSIKLNAKKRKLYVFLAVIDDISYFWINLIYFLEDESSIIS